MNSDIKKYNISGYFAWMMLTLIVSLTVVLRLSMLNIPLERDEGEYAYMGQLLLQGIPPYFMAYSMKLPGLSFIYAIVMGVFGQSISAIHLGLLIFNGIAVILVFLLTRYFSDEIAGVWAALVYALLSVSPSVWGTAAHATQFLAPFVLGGILLMLMAVDRKKSWMLIISGFLLGFAFLIKQHAIFFLIFSVLYYFYMTIRKTLTGKEILSGAAILMLSFAIPFLAVCGLLYFCGVFSTFWFWTFSYARQYALETSISMAISRLAQAASIVIGPWRLIWIIAGIGLSSVLWSKKIRSKRFFIAGFSLFSFLSICPGYYFRFHYFITLLPAVAMLSGIAVSASITYLSQRFSPFLKTIPVIFIIFALSLPAWEQKRFFLADPIAASYMIYGISNPFPESLPVAEYIRKNSLPSDTVAVVGSEPQIYFYANRKSATGYIYMYGLMERQIYASQMQQAMIREIESARPRFIVLVSANYSWLRTADSDVHILNWIKEYLKKYYRLRGVIDAASDMNIKTSVHPADTDHLWDHAITIFEIRK